MQNNPMNIPNKSIALSHLCDAQPKMQSSSTQKTWSTPTSKHIDANEATIATIAVVMKVY
jgi:hypothetical protein